MGNKVCKKKYRFHKIIVLFSVLNSFSLNKNTSIVKNKIDVKFYH